MTQHRYPQFFLDSQQTATVGKQCTLSSEDSHHICSVLRLETGSFIQVIDPNNNKAFLAELSTTSKKSAEIKIKKEIELKFLKSPVSSLLIASLKGKNTSLVCEKAVELGVTNLIIFEAERSVKKLDPKDNKTLDRFNKIAKSAAKQSNKTFLPKIFLYESLQKAILKVDTLAKDTDKRLCCSLKQEDIKLSDIDSTIQVHLIIGPEGDFTEVEYNNLSQSGWEHISLGPFVLRSETAAIAGLAMLSAILGYK